MNWMFFGITAGLFFAIYNSLLKDSSVHVHALIGSIALSVGSALFSLLLVLAFKAAGQEIKITSDGVKMAMLAGVFSAIGGFCYFVMYQKKAPISLGLPLLSVSTIIFSAIIGLMFFGEKLTTVKIVGLILAAISIGVMNI